MERLTRQGSKYAGLVKLHRSIQLSEELEPEIFDAVQEAINRLEAYEETGLTPEQINETKKIPEFPCKIGAFVYETGFGLPIQQKVIGFHIGNLMDEDEEYVYSDTEWTVVMDHQGIKTAAYLSEFGKSIFLTREEAKEAGDV